MTVDIFNASGRYDLILADPPWKQSKGGKKSVRKNSSGKPLDYGTCTLDEIERHLKVATELTDDNATRSSEQARRERWQTITGARLSGSK